jgi:quercetin dioxygenase-like cupin family protein
MPFVDTNEIVVKEPLPGWQGRYFSSQSMTFGYYAVEAGASIHEHAHPNEEVWHVLSGELEVTIAGETRVAGPGCVAVVPANQPHSVRARTAGRSIVVDSPRRDAVGSVKTS